MKEIVLVGGTNDGTRLHTNDISKDVQLVRRGQVSVSCDGKGLDSTFETYRPIPVTVVGGYGVFFAEESLSPLQALATVVEGYHA